MDIPVYKNYWYIAAAFATVFIFFLAFVSTKQINLIIVSPEGGVILNLELIYRLMFNPVWAIVLFFWDKGRKANSEHHDRILQNVQGVISDAMRSGRQNIRTDSLATLVYRQENVARDIARRLEDADTITEDRGNPIP